MSTASTTARAEPDPENTLILELEHGKVVIEMLSDLAPDHVRQIKELTREGFYDGIVFHRVMEGFMAQTGDPTGTGRGSSDKPDLAAEFSAEPFVRGVIGMARSQNPNSGNSQWFICLGDARFLDKQYTVWGRVVYGLDTPIVDVGRQGSIQHKACLCANVATIQRNHGGQYVPEPRFASQSEIV